VLRRKRYVPDTTLTIRGDETLFDWTTKTPYILSAVLSWVLSNLYFGWFSLNPNRYPWESSFTWHTWFVLGAWNIVFAALVAGVVAIFRN
jgi:hypothetical protein